MYHKTNEVGLYLKKMRIKAGLTQVELASKLGYGSAQFISNIERGLASPPLKSLKTLSGLINLEPSHLYKIMKKEHESHLAEMIYGKKRKNA